MNLNNEAKDAIHNFMGAAQACSVWLRGYPAARTALYDYCTFLMTDPNLPGRYRLLTGFLEWYGSWAILPAVEEIIEGWNGDRLHRRWHQLVELGAGSGWLGLALSGYFSKLSLVDKRPENAPRPEIIQALDVESQEEEVRLWLESVNVADTLILANHFLHCLDDPARIISRLHRCSWLVVEPLSEAPMRYWDLQLIQAGARPVKRAEVDQYMEAFGLGGDMETRVNHHWVKLYAPKG